jgi:hypothetical protein
MAHTQQSISLAYTGILGRGEEAAVGMSGRGEVAAVGM